MEEYNKQHTFFSISSKILDIFKLGFLEEENFIEKVW